MDLKGAGMVLKYMCYEPDWFMRCNSIYSIVLLQSTGSRLDFHYNESS